MKPLLRLSPDKSEVVALPNRRGSYRRVWAAAIVVTCIPVFTLIFWKVSPLPKSSLASSRRKATGFNPKLLAGVGTEVPFASDNASDEQVRASVDSLAKFIEGRSGLSIDQNTRTRLVSLESDSLNGRTTRIPIDDFVVALTTSVADRISTLTDQEIEYAASVLRIGDSKSVMLRSRGGLSMQTDEFVEEATSLREQCQQNRHAARAAIRSVLKDEVQKSATALSTGLPDQFGQITTRGLTPAQAVLLTYSLVTDDSLEFSHVQIENRVKHPLLAKNPGVVASSVEQIVVKSDARAYGPNGKAFSSPADLIFNTATLTDLLDRLAKGEN
jgi:hypothetical protein